MLYDRDFDGFEWDQQKSDRTFEERGIDFEAAAQVFDDAYLEEPSLRQDYGETRFKVIGLVEGIIVVVVWTPRGSKRRIISARRCRPEERKAYYEFRESRLR